MADPVTDNPATRAGRKGLAKLKGLPTWAYVAAAGVGLAVVYYALMRNRAAAAADVADTTGSESATYGTGAGDPYASPYGSSAAGGGVTDSSGTNANETTTDIIRDLIDLGILPTGGGGNTAPDPNQNYTPPTIVLNIPDSAVSAPQTIPTPIPKPTPTSPSHPWGNGPDPCTGEYPYYQDQGSRKGQCYKVVHQNGKRYKFYKNGDKVIYP